MQNNYIIEAIVAVAIVGIGGFFLMSSNNTTDNTAMNDTEKPVMKEESKMEVKEEKQMEEAKMGPTIVDIAVSNPDFSTLVTAVTEAGLAETLASEGPFTVFAPTNSAFAKLPAGTVEGLLQDKAALTGVLTYHVVPGKVMAKDVVGLTEATTVNGQKIKISINANGEVMINESKVITADIETSNGVIHVIDKVLLPE